MKSEPRTKADSYSAGIVHRDLKPENVMLTGDGFVIHWRIIHLKPFRELLGSFHEAGRG